MRIPLVLATLATLASAVPSTARAQDTWSDPFPGVRRLHRRTANQNINVLQVDLCAPGVSLRATAGSERGRTASSFGTLVGAQAVINGDFFSAGYNTDGLSVHAGAHWSGGDHGYVAPLAFGHRRVELRPHEDQTGLEPWMQEVVSGHPTILWDGQRRDNNGDPLCSNRHPRTAVGLSADRRTLIMAVVDGRATSRIGMTCDELSALLAEMGAHSGMNLDGGGSSTMWLGGAGVVNVPSDGSQRVTANHLAVHATGAGEAPMCPNKAPRGYLDGAACEAVTGWAQDEDRPDEPIDVHVYFDGGPGEPGALAIAARADLERADLCDAIGSCAHGYAVPVPGALRDGLPHPVQVFGIDSEGGENPLLAGGPMEVTCAPPDPPLGPSRGVLRHVVSADSLHAWGMQFHDVVPLGEARVAEYAEGAPLPELPDLVRAAGEPAVYVLDAGVRRHVQNPESMAAWGLDPAAVRELTAEELEAIPPGAAFPAAPFPLRGEGPAVYVIDVSDPTDPDAEVPGTEGNTLGGGCAAAGGGLAGGLAAGLLALLAVFAVVRPRRRRG